MIYVVESMTSNTPVRLARAGSSIAAYATREAAERAARALGGVVREYAVARATVSDGEEHLARVVDGLQASARRVAMERDERTRGEAALRAKYGARDDETMGQWIARLHRGYQDLQVVRAALAAPEEAYR